jgi:hypothetical protein
MRDLLRHRSKSHDQPNIRIRHDDANNIHDALIDRSAWKRMKVKQ